MWYDTVASAMKHTRVNELFYKRLGWGEDESQGDRSNSYSYGQADCLSRNDERALRVSLCYQYLSIILLSLIALLLTAILIHQSEWETCTRKHSVYSPILNVIADDYQTWRFNGTFRESSPYKGPPNAKVDAAWNDLYNFGAVRISEKDLYRINGSSIAAKFPSEAGGGYLGFVEVLHQLHCVNLLWQHIYKDYYESRSDAFKDSPPVLYEHLNHCADLLRQKIMCDADAGLIPLYWVKHHDHPYPDFNTLHKCRNFDAVWQWARKHQVSMPNGGVLLRPDDAVELNLPP